MDLKERTKIMRLPVIKKIMGYPFIPFLFMLMLGCETFAGSDVMKPEARRGCRW